MGIGPGKLKSMASNSSSPVTVLMGSLQVTVLLLHCDFSFVSVSALSFSLVLSFALSLAWALVC